MKLPNRIFSGYHGSCHCQGIAVDKKNGFIYYSFTTKLVKADLYGNTVGTVDGLIGHLGCIDFCEEDGKVYGSLEYKNDSIGRGILGALDRADAKLNNAFYAVIFDVDRIDRIGMNAETDGIMRAVYLPEVVEDFSAEVELGGVKLPHRYGCSGIDGLGRGPYWGKTDGKEYLRICYGIYGDTERTDNDHQVILTFDTGGWWDTAALPLCQSDMHRSGTRSVSKCFFRTGNTNWGVQNLEYDAYLKRWMLAVYRGGKAAFDNYDMFFIPSETSPVLSLHEAYGEEILTLPLTTAGIYFPYGSTGMYALGDGRYYFSQSGKSDRGQYTEAVLYRATGDEKAPFAVIE